jgi:hypothetical protein
LGDRENFGLVDENWYYAAATLDESLPVLSY